MFQAVLDFRAVFCCVLLHCTLLTSPCKGNKLLGFNLTSNHVQFAYLPLFVRPWWPLQTILYAFFGKKKGSYVPVQENRQKNIQASIQRKERLLHYPRVVPTSSLAPPPQYEHYLRERLFEAFSSFYQIKWNHPHG